MRLTHAQPVRHTYSTGRVFYLVACEECQVVLNSGHHYHEQPGGGPSPHAVKLVVEHDAEFHSGD